MTIALSREEEIVLFHYRLGVAITQWSYVESGLGDIVVNLFTSHYLNQQSVGVGFFSLEGFRAKLKFADEVVRRKLADPQHAQALIEWEKLVSKSRKSSIQRNNLAHWQIAKYWDCEPGKRVVLRPWIFPKPTKEKDKSKPPKGSKRIMDLINDSQEFQVLGDSLQDFLGQLLCTGRRLRESPESTFDRMTVHKLKLQIREVFSVQQKSSSPKS